MTPAQVSHMAVLADRILADDPDAPELHHAHRAMVSAYDEIRNVPIYVIEIEGHYFATLWQPPMGPGGNVLGITSLGHSTDEFFRTFGRAVYKMAGGISIKDRAEDG